MNTDKKQTIMIMIDNDNIKLHIDNVEVGITMNKW